MRLRLSQGMAAGAGVPARLGLLNGMLIGLAVALGALGPSALAAGGAAAFLWYASLLFGLLCLVALAGLTGWVTAFFHKTALALLLWTAAGVGVTAVLGHLPYEGSTLVAWLLDRRFWGLPLYPFSPAALARQVMAGFFILLPLVILGLLQPHRLEGIAASCTADRRLTGQTWFLLLLPLPLLFGVGLIADNLVYQPVRRALGLTEQVIRTARTYEGDLFALSIERGVNYNAAAGVRHLLSSGYTLRVGEIDLGAAGTVFVVAHFDNGAWINCRIVADQMSFCWDASPAYQRGLPALLAGQAVEGCPECNVVVDASARAALDAQQGRFAEPPRARRLAQQGSYVWMRAESAAGDQVVDCLLRGITPVRLVACRSVAPVAQRAVKDENVAGCRPRMSHEYTNSAPWNACLRENIHGWQATIFRADARAAPGATANEIPHLSGTSEVPDTWGIPRTVRPGRAPGLLALAPLMATPVAPAGVVAPERDGEPMGMATPDRLSPPPTVYPPTQADLGAQAYWFRCMVCHGDRGQGLTEEWRNAWDPAHRNCWQSRCHASNHPPEGFQLPYYAPPVIGPGTLARFATLADLHSYLAAQMPWQAPGSLPAEEYWQLAAYLARANGVSVSDAHLNADAAARVLLHPPEVPAATAGKAAPIPWPVVAGVMLPLALWVLVFIRRKQR